MISLNVYPGVTQNDNSHTHLISGPKQKAGSRYVISCYCQLPRMIVIRNFLSVSQCQLLLKYMAHRWKFDKHFAMQNREFCCADI